jgi:hypothetical protein
MAAAVIGTVVQAAGMPVVVIGTAVAGIMVVMVAVGELDPR